MNKKHLCLIAVLAVLTVLICTACGGKTDPNPSQPDVTDSSAAVSDPANDPTGSKNSTTGTGDPADPTSVTDPAVSGGTTTAPGKTDKNGGTTTTKSGNSTTGGSAVIYGTNETVLAPTQEKQEGVYVEHNVLYKHTVLYVEEVGAASGGTRVTGAVINGTLKAGDAVMVFGKDGVPTDGTVKSITDRSAKKEVSQCSDGMFVDLVISGIPDGKIARGSTVMDKNKSFISSNVVVGPFTKLAVEEDGTADALSSGEVLRFRIGNTDYAGSFTKMEDDPVKAGETTPYARAFLNTPVVIFDGLEIPVFREDGMRVGTFSAVTIDE